MKNVVFLLGLLMSVIFSHAQESTNTKPNYREHVKTIDSTIDALYHAISGEKGEARQWELFKFLFKPDAKLIPSGKNAKGNYQVRYLKPDDYIKSSGDWLIENGFFEKEIARTVNLFGSIAHVFSTYESFKSEADEKPFMRGINSIQLFHDGTRWWVVNIYWTNETKNNPIPKTYLP